MREMSAKAVEIKELDFLDELAAVLVASLTKDAGFEPEAARRAADQQVDRVRAEFGGSKRYIPRRKYADVEAVRREIGRLWNGSNTAELCRKFGISETWLRELHAQAHGRVYQSRARPRRG